MRKEFFRASLKASPTGRSGFPARSAHRRAAQTPRRTRRILIRSHQASGFLIDGLLVGEVTMSFAADDEKIEHLGGRVDETRLVDGQEDVVPLHVHHVLAAVEPAGQDDVLLIEDLDGARIRRDQLVHREDGIPKGGQREAVPLALRHGPDLCETLRVAPNRKGGGSRPHRVASGAQLKEMLQRGMGVGVESHHPQSLLRRGLALWRQPLDLAGEDLVLVEQAPLVGDLEVRLGLRVRDVRVPRRATSKENGCTDGEDRETLHPSSLRSPNFTHEPLCPRVAFTRDTLARWGPNARSGTLPR